MSSQASTAAVVKRAQPAPMNAKDALTELDNGVSLYETELTNIAEETIAVKAAGAAAVRDYLEPAERELRGDMTRLRTDMETKIAKIKELQSKFSFALGTMTTRIENEDLLTDVDETTQTASKRR